MLRRGCARGKFLKKIEANVHAASMDKSLEFEN